MYISLRNAPASTGSAPRARGVRTVSSTVITLGVVSMLTDISSESVSAVLPLYVTGMLGLSVIAFGLIDGLHQGVSAVVRIASGYTSDRIDRPKWVAFAGYAAAMVARIGLLFASGFAALSAVIVADRIGKGIRTAPRDVMITIASPPADLGRAFGVHRMLDNIGAALGPLIAFVILLVVPDGYAVVFTASLAFAVIGVLILGLIVPNLRSRGKTDAALSPDREASGAALSATAAPVRNRLARDRPARARMTDVWRGPMRRVLAVSGLLGILTIGDGFVYLVLQSRSDFAAQWFPLLYVGTNVAFLAFAIPFGRLADRIGRARVFVFGHLGLLAAYVVAVLAWDDAVATVLCLFFLGAFYAATDGVLAALAAQLTTPDNRGTGIAAAQTVVAVSRFLSAAGFGVLWFTVGPEVSLLIVAAALAVAIPLVLLLLRPFLSSARQVPA
ncbi:MFS transporter [Microbacterium sp. cx-55]|uniref:MFS transporter n=1 Tax=Microbacterium sp. cx-55 TaxID=2875948 RepID=UPI001CBDE272|nr:MFS transporter [Microbacterium sp. cx-55]MBZ4486912.1 MFS transporter [Microbacterium sp. cx-55]UGB35835.1 MFS transporter [Microbacterium sp. cx-55]